MSQTKNATFFLAKLPVPEEDDEPISTFFEKWILILKKKDIDLFNKIEKGDFLENIKESGHRSEGLYMFDKNDDGKVTICELETDCDDYGTIPRRFELITQFKNPVYWMDNSGFINSKKVKTFCSDTYPNAYFHNSCVYIPFNKLHDFVTLATQEDAAKYNVNILNTIKISYEGDIYFVTDEYFYGFYYSRLTGKKYVPHKKSNKSINYEKYESCYVECGTIKWIKGT